MAKENIDAKQAKDKEYYHREHADPKVTYSSIIVKSDNFVTYRYTLVMLRNSASQRKETK